PPAPPRPSRRPTTRGATAQPAPADTAATCVSVRPLGGALIPAPFERERVRLRVRCSRPTRAFRARRLRAPTPPRASRGATTQPEPADTAATCVSVRPLGGALIPSPFERERVTARGRCSRPTRACRARRLRARTP